MDYYYRMLLLLWRCQLRHINHASINISTSIPGGRRWHGNLRIRWSPKRYWIILQLWHCVLWRAGWLLTNRGRLRWINEWIIQCRRHRYQRWWQLVALWVTVLTIKAPVIMRSVWWSAGWLLKNRGHLRWINDWIIQWRRHRYHRSWQLIALWVYVLAIKAPFITRIRFLPTLIFPCSTFLAANNKLWTCHYECNMSLWWCCVPVIFCCWWPSKGESKLFGSTNAVMF